MYSNTNLCVMTISDAQPTQNVETYRMEGFYLNIVDCSLLWCLVNRCVWYVVWCSSEVLQTTYLLLRSALMFPQTFQNIDI